MAAARPVQRFETFLSSPRRKTGHVQCFVYDIDKGLCIIPNEAMDRVTLILTGEDRFDQGGEFMQSERASDQTSTGCSVGVEEEERVGGQSAFRTRSAKVRLKTYRFQIQRL